MTINQIKCFLTLAEMLNFTRASEALNMTQPTLSKMLTSMEDEIGVHLFYRTKRSVQLTTAGKCIRPYFEQIISTFNSGISSAQSVCNGKVGTIKIGFSSNIVNEILPKLVHKMSVQYPNIDIQLVDGTQEELLHLMNTDKLDMIFVDSYAVKRASNFDYIPVLRDCVCGFVSTNNTLSKKKFISINDLKQEKILTAGRIMGFATSPLTSNPIVSEILNAHGLITCVSHNSRTISNMLTLTDCNMGVAILPSKFAVNISKNIVCVPIIVDENDPSSTLDIEIMLAWRKNEKNNFCVNNLLSVLSHIVEI